jgi:hypothetical protein
MYSGSCIHHDHSSRITRTREEAMSLFRRADGEDQPDERCPQCGERLPEDEATVCTMCGAALDPASKARPEATR